MESESASSKAMESGLGTKPNQSNPDKHKAAAIDSSSEQTDRNSSASTVRNIYNDRVRMSAHHRNADPQSIKEIMHESNYSSSSLAESKLFDVQNEETFDSDMVLATRISNRLFN